jgi:hypothetical protein
MRVRLVSPAGHWRTVGLLLAVLAVVLIILVGRRPGTNAVTFGRLEVPLAETHQSATGVVLALRWTADDVADEVDRSAPCPPLSRHLVWNWGNANTTDSWPSTHVDVCETAGMTVARATMLLTKPRDFGGPTNMIDVLDDDRVVTLAAFGADQFDVTCLELVTVGSPPPGECRNWIFRGAYGQYVAAYEFNDTGSAVHGFLPATVFLGLAQEFDSSIERLLR